MLPDAVIRPLPKLSSYPLSLRTKRRRVPTAMMVTPEAPVKVVRKAQMRMLMKARPPGSQPNRERNRRTRRSPDLLSEMM